MPTATRTRRSRREADRVDGESKTMSADSRGHKRLAFAEQRTSRQPAGVEQPAFSRLGRTLADPPIVAYWRIELAANHIG